MGVFSFPKEIESTTRWPRAMHHQSKYKLQRLKFEVNLLFEIFAKTSDKVIIMGSNSLAPIGSMRVIINYDGDLERL